MGKERELKRNGVGRLCPQLHDELVVLELGLKLASLVLPSFLLPASLACALKVLTRFHDERTPGCIIPTITTFPIGQSRGLVLEAAPAAKNCTAHPTT
jgi:hypothetical protein